MSPALMGMALLPSVVLLIYIYKKDKADKEPFGQLVKAFVLGMVIGCVGAMIFETIGSEFLLNFLSEDSNLYQFLDNFFVIGLSEECFKFLALYLCTRKNKEFNSLFDGMIYSVCSSLGFATLENILYVAENGFSVAVSRAVLSVPAHFFFGVFMGYFYSYYHMNKLACRVENEYANLGVITKRSPAIEYKSNMALALIVPIVFHGFYDFCLSVDVPYISLAFVATVIVLYIFGFSRVKMLSKADTADNVYVYSLLYNKYPELQQYIYQQQLQQQQMAQQYAYQAQMYQNTYQPTQQPSQYDTSYFNH